jgi:hypothetical protein
MVGGRTGRSMNTNYPELVVIEAIVTIELY